MKNLTGTLAVTHGSTSVTGTGTKFRAELAKGAILIVQGLPRSVASVGSDTSFTLASPFTGKTCPEETAELG